MRISNKKKREIRKSILINASPEVVFRAITDPNEITNWFPDHAILEPMVGGKMKFSFYKQILNTDRWTFSLKGLLLNSYQMKRSLIPSMNLALQVFPTQL